MAQKSRFYKVTKGFNAEVLVAKAVAYTTRATFDLFVANAVEGEIGIYNADTNAVIGANIPIVAGTRFFIAQKRDGGIFKTTPSIYAAASTRKVAYTAPVKQVSTVTFTGLVPVAGKVWSVKVIETTPGNEPFPSMTYEVLITAGMTLTQAVAALVVKINSLTNPMHRDGLKIVSATSAVGVLTLTADYFQSSFRVATPGEAYELGATSVVTTPFKMGSGYSDHVASWETEGQIYDGVTTQYPGGLFAPSDFASPTSFTVDGLLYDIYHLIPVKNEKSPTPINQHHHYWNAVLCVPTVGGPAVAISTIFGFTAPTI